MSPRGMGPERVAQELIDQAKSIISEELERGLEVTIKADNSPVTQIDIRINQVAVELIGRQFPDDAVYAEEGNGGKGTSGYTWVIDPIDGTRALELGMPTYTVCVARVASDGTPDFSYVYNPSTDDIYAVRRSERAMKNSATLAVNKDATVLSGELVYVSSRMPAEVLPSEELCKRLVTAGAERVTTHSISSGVLLVAEGKAVAAIAGTSKPYELASVKPLVEGAGGIVSDLGGNPIDRCDSKIGGFIAAANKKVLQEVLDIYRGEGRTQSHLSLIREYVPGAQNIVPVKSGYVNDVYIVDEAYVFRFPRSADWRQVLLLEVEVLKKLDGRVTLTIPAVQHIENDGSYAVFSFIPGSHRSSADIRGMEPGYKRYFARDIARFLVELNDAVPHDWMAKRVMKIPVERKDDAKYYEELLELGRNNDNPYYEKYRTCYERLASYRAQVFSSEEIVIHGDLHSGNFIFDINDRLAGIFDFGDCMVNTVYFELRQLYHFGDDVLEMAIESLSGRFGVISKEAVRLLAVAHEFSILMRLGSTEETPYDKDRSAIAKKLLQRWGEL